MLRISQALGLMVSSHRVDSLLINIAIFIFKVLCVIPLPSLFKKGFGRASAAKAFLLIISGRKDESSYPLYTVHYLSVLYYYCIIAKGGREMLPSAALLAARFIQKSALCSQFPSHDFGHCSFA